jgi:hypothetical protein
MPANEFEKQVQKQLDDFQLNPSASVWKKVEEQIRNKKRRRVLIFFILPAALCLLGYSVYQFMSTGQKTGSAQQQVSLQGKKTEKTTIKETQTADAIQQPLKNNTDNTAESANNQKIQKQESAINQNQQNAMNVLVTQPSVTRTKKSNAGKSISKDDTESIKRDNSLVINTTAPSTIHAGQPATHSEQSISNVENKTNEETTPIKETATAKNEVTTEDKNTVASPLKKDSAAADAVVITDTKETVPQKNNKKPKIKWGIDFSAGITSNHTGIFSMEKSLNASMAMPGTGTATGGPIPVNPPSTIRSGAGFRIGIIGELQLSPKSHVSAGLEYDYSSNRIKTGSGVDTTINLQVPNTYSVTQINRIYRGVAKNDYTNSYHFISIPVQYHWLFSKKLQWDIGASFSYLLSTNALVYSESYGGIYFRDKGVVNKTHVDVSTGLSFRFRGGKGKEWVIGPEISFDTKPLMNNQYGTRQYLMYGGIHTRLLFPQKKK